jgi:hypothetical protein
MARSNNSGKDSPKFNLREQVKNKQKKINKKARKSGLFYCFIYIGLSDFTKPG